MSPKWFQNIKFGQDRTNIGDDLVKRFKNQFEDNLKDFTFSEPQSVIIEEVFSEDEEQEERNALPPPASPSSARSSQAPPSPAPPSPAASSPAASSPAASSPAASSPASPSPASPSSARSSPAPPSQAAPSPVTPSPAASVEEQAPSTAPAPISAATSGSLPTAESLRRSNRPRWKPLDFARGQRPVYKRNGSTFELAYFDEGFPEKNNYGRKKQIKKKSNSSKLPKLPTGCLVAEPIRLKPAKKGDYRLQINSNEYFVDGVVHLEPGKTKPEAQASIDKCYFFRARVGQIIITQGKSKKIYMDESSNWVKLDVGTKYTIKNCGKENADVLYIVTDRKCDE